MIRLDIVYDTPCLQGVYFLSEPLSGEKLKSGITTGTCAAAAAKAAVLAWQGFLPASVEIETPQGKILNVPVDFAERSETAGKACIIKDAGDDPDITHGVQVIAEVSVTVDQPEIVLIAGDGIGTVTLPGLQIPVGEPAINPVPRKMIAAAIRSVLAEEVGARVVISIPGGEKLARRTLNPTLGIAGGLSIIGTTGIVEPMSEEAFKNSLKPQISVARAQGFDVVVMAPGKIGQDIAVQQFGIPAAAVVQTSNFIGFMLESAVELGVKEILLFGHLGKLVKVAGGIFHTHNRMADARMETLAAYMAAEGASRQAVQAVLQCTTTEAAIPILAEHGLNAVYSVLAERASLRARRFVFEELSVGTVIVSMKGELLGMDAAARRIGGNLQWNIS